MCWERKLMIIKVAEKLLVIQEKWKWKSLKTQLFFNLTTKSGSVENRWELIHLFEFPLWICSVKWSHPVHFLKALKVNVFCHFLVPFLKYFWHLKVTNQGFKKFSGWLHLTLLSFLQYLDNYLGQLILSIF